MLFTYFCVSYIILNLEPFGALTPKQLPCYFTSEYLLQGTTFVSFSSVTSTLKLKTHSQLTEPVHEH